MSDPWAGLRGHLRARGWAVARGCLSPAEVAPLVAAFDRCVGSPGPVVQRPSAHRLDPALRGWILGDRLGRMARGVLECPRVRLLQDALIAKAPRSAGEVPWHRDAAYIGYLPPDRVISLRLALGPETPRSGGLEVLDGSHRAEGEVGLRHGAAEVEDGLGRLPADDPLWDGRVAVVLDAGDVSIHGPRTWHRSAANGSARPRRTVVVHAFDADAPVDLDAVDPALRPHFTADARGRLEGAAFPVLG